MEHFTPEMWSPIVADVLLSVAILIVYTFVLIGPLWAQDNAIARRSGTQGHSDTGVGL